MSSHYHSFENIALLDSASEGCKSGLLEALRSGADINVVDSAGRTALTCALAADRWDAIDASDVSFMSEERLATIRHIVSHPDITLFSLNAPQESIAGVSPLGMAAWLKLADAVAVLLEHSNGLVSVDGSDADGATPLMYAARDGTIEVVQLLLTHGARPDARDRYHRSPVQFALSHACVLSRLEDSLRQWRWSETESNNRRHLRQPGYLPQDFFSYSPSSSLWHQNPSSVPDIYSPVTDSLVQVVLTSDISTLYSLLFPSYALDDSMPPSRYPLVNARDVEGWSPVHYCASVYQPSLEVLDALYRAGADVNLFTLKEQYTPLHCLARFARFVDHPESALSLYEFAVHLIRDLEAPLSSQDANEETCIHIAAEHGECIDVLVAFLDCDFGGHVQNMRNSRGLTAFEVAKPCFRSYFKTESAFVRPQSALSDRTIRPPQPPMRTLSYLAGWLGQSGRQTPQSIYRPYTDIDVFEASGRILDDIDYVAVEVQYAHGSGLDNLQRMVEDVGRVGKDLIAVYRRQAEEATQNVRELRQNLGEVDLLWERTSHDIDQLEDLNRSGLVSLMARKRLYRGSEDSQLTAVCSEVDAKDGSFLKDLEEPSYQEACVATEALRQIAIETTDRYTGVRCVPWPEWLDSFILSADSSTYKTHLANLIEIEKELLARENPSNVDKPLPKEPRLRSILSNRRSQLLKMEKSSVSKLKGWLKKKVVSNKPFSLEIVYDLDDECAVGTDVKQPPAPITLDLREPRSPTIAEGSEGSGLKPVLAAVGRDLTRIDECLRGVDKFILAISNSASRAERIINRTLKAQGAEIERRRAENVKSGVVLNDIFAFTTNMIDSPQFPDYTGHNISSGSGSSSSGSNSSYCGSPSSSSPRSTLCSPLSSAASSTVSFQTYQNEAEDARALRQLLRRKLTSAVSNAESEIARANVWLTVLKETLRDVRNRTIV